MNSDRRKTILIVDDDDDLLEGMRLLFEDEGWNVLTHDGRTDIMSVIHQNDFDLLVIDVFLPHDNGSSIAWQTRQETPNQKIILISAAGQLNRLGSAANVDAYLQKPFRLEQLSELAEKVLDTPHNDNNGRGGSAGQDQSFRLFESGPLAYSRTRVPIE